MLFSPFLRPPMAPAKDFLYLCSTSQSQAKPSKLLLKPTPSKSNSPERWLFSSLLNVLYLSWSLLPPRILVRLWQEEKKMLAYSTVSQSATRSRDHHPILHSRTCDVLTFPIEYIFPPNRYFLPLPSSMSEKGRFALL